MGLLSIQISIRIGASLVGGSSLGILVGHLDAQLDVKHIQIHTSLGREGTITLASIIIGTFLLHYLLVSI